MVDDASEYKPELNMPMQIAFSPKNPAKAWRPSKDFLWSDILMFLGGVLVLAGVLTLLGFVPFLSGDAVEQAVWLEHGNRHSAHIHSKNIDNITTYAKAIDTAILVKNAPSYAALGFGGEGYCTFTIASRTGEGLTSASTFTKRRRCVMSDSLCIR